jgi:hypothetical protein
MSDPLITAPATVAPSDIRFFDSIQPPLVAGSYTLNATQEIKGLKEGAVDPYKADLAFDVDGPRFAIDPASIHMVFPPANQLGNYYDVLPNIVFTNFALPWLRNIDPKGGEDPSAPPWIALLTIYDTEMPVAPSAVAPPGSDPRLSMPATVPVGEVVTPKDATVLPPDLPGVDPNSIQKALVTDVDLAFFRAIAPTASELALLAHARAVNTDGKVLLGLDEDGCFSVLVGNRMAKKGATNTVLLVSLEGHKPHLPGGGPIDAKYKTIRLIVLGSWSFQASDSPGSFLALMAQLCEAGRGGVKLLQMPQLPAAEPLAQEAIAIGYVPMQNDMRIGETSTAWYRGPFAPAPTAEDFAYGPYPYSDKAIHYDPDYGVFNHAYAAAWQIGRLLALSDATFAKSLTDWRRTHFAALSRAAQRRDVEGRIAAHLNGDAMPVGAGLGAQLRHFMATGVHGARARVPTVTPRDRDPRLATLPGVLSRDEVAAILESGEDPLVVLKRKLNGGAKP